jgi:hypothetical protein
VERHVELIREVEHSCFPLCGGSALCDVDDKYIAPTVLVSPPRDCRLMKEEIFGPILPVIIVKSREEAIEFIRQQVSISATRVSVVASFVLTHSSLFPLHIVWNTAGTLCLYKFGTCLSRNAPRSALWWFLP